MTTTTEPKRTIEQLAHEHMEARARDIRDIMERQEDTNETIADQAYEDFYQYGLCFDYVAPYTFEDQRAGYWRWQISWGGPAEEFRIYVDPETDRVKEVDFFYTEGWGDDHTINLDRVYRLNANKFLSGDLNRVFCAIDQLMDGR